MNVVGSVYFLIALLFCMLSGCWSANPNEVVVYCALDREFAEPVLNQFTTETGVAVRAVYDVEASKTVGLVERILQERDRPACDVFWNNEALHTLRLANSGVLLPYPSQAAAAIPAAFRSADGRWHGFAARARVLIVNTNLVPIGQRPASIEDLADPKWRGRCAIARPLFGTTATHAACLFASLGRDKAQQLFERMKLNKVKILAGNKQVAQAVVAGDVAFGLTDTDDAIIELEAGRPVVIVYPDQAPGQLGTLFIPNTLGIITGGPHPETARRLVDYLLSPSVEQTLARGASAQIPLRHDPQLKLRVETPATVRAMQVDFAAAAKEWETVGPYLRDEFLQP